MCDLIRVSSSGPTGSFFHKPLRGWIYPDSLILSKGVTFNVRYVGCLDVNTSMKNLDFDSRFQIAKECINRVCEVAGLKTVDRKRKVDKKVAKSIGEHPDMKYAGSDVNLMISSVCLTIKTMTQDSDITVASHEMPRISFASGGDAETLDFVAYVAKDVNNWRACFVLECGGGLAQDVITTIGQAFDLRFKQYLHTPQNIISRSDEREREYYNDMPGKVPPDVTVTPSIPSLPNINRATSNETRERLPSTNLIDLNCEVSAPITQNVNIHEYTNDIVAMNDRSYQPRDVFDMQPFGNESLNSNARLKDEVWFHGSIGRQQAESLLRNDGDFLVRESLASPGQYVLTGIQGGVKKHLLLIDPEGVVRTKDRMFESVSHLVNYHCQKKLPIISAESALILRNPIHVKK